MIECVSARAAGLTGFAQAAHMVRVAAHELRVNLPVGFTARQPL